MEGEEEEEEERKRKTGARQRTHVFAPLCGIPQALGDALQPVDLEVALLQKLLCEGTKRKVSSPCRSIPTPSAFHHLPPP